MFAIITIKTIETICSVFLQKPAFSLPYSRNSLKTEESQLFFTYDFWNFLRQQPSSPSPSLSSGEGPHLLVFMSYTPPHGSTITLNCDYIFTCLSPQKVPQKQEPSFFGGEEGLINTAFLLGTKTTLNLCYLLNFFKRKKLWIQFHDSQKSYLKAV